MFSNHVNINTLNITQGRSQAQLSEIKEEYWREFIC